MNDFIGVIAVLLAVACMHLAQSKTVAKTERRLYSLLGSGACTAIAVEASQRGAQGIAVTFAAAAVFSLIGLVLSYLSPE